jgi:hypothetical protein
MIEHIEHNKYNVSIFYVLLPIPGYFLEHVTKIKINVLEHRGHVYFHVQSVCFKKIIPLYILYIIKATGKLVKNILLIQG